MHHFVDFVSLSQTFYLMDGTVQGKCVAGEKQRVLRSVYCGLTGCRSPLSDTELTGRDSLYRGQR